MYVHVFKKASVAEAKADTRCEKRGLAQPRCSRIPFLGALPQCLWPGLAERGGRILSAGVSVLLLGWVTFVEGGVDPAVLSPSTRITLANSSPFPPYHKSGEIGWRHLRIHDSFSFHHTILLITSSRIHQVPANSKKFRRLYFFTPALYGMDSLTTYSSNLWNTSMVSIFSPAGSLIFPK